MLFLIVWANIQYTFWKYLSVIQAKIFADQLLEFGMYE